MTAPGDSQLVAVVLPAPEAAAAVRHAWDRGRAVAVLDPAAPRLRERLTALAPTHVVDADGERPEDGGRGVPAGVGAVVATSGTTGDPRLVELTFDALRASATAVHAALGVDAGRDRWLACLPLHHVAGLAIVARGYWTGTPVTVHERFDVDAVAAVSGTTTLISVVPTTLRRLLETHPTELARFRRVLVGGAALTDALRKAAVDAGVRVVTTYGLTETGGGCVHDGHPLPGVDIAVAGAAGDRGEILVRGPVLFRGYRAPAGDRPAPELPDRDGWFPTGDVGQLDASGHLTVVDRLGDLIITGGVNVSPVAVEAGLADAPGIADLAVAGRADEEWGERVVAYVVPTDPTAPPTLASLRAAGAASGLAPAELPREVRLCSEIPRTAGGKIRRARLRRS